MDENSLQIIREIEEVEQQMNEIVRVPKVYIRDIIVQDPMSMYTEDEFKFRYR